MSTFLNQAETASRLIAKNGRAITVTRPGSGGTLDPVTDTVTGGADVPYTFTAVGLPPTQAERFKVGSLEGRDVMEFYFALTGAATQPQPGDVVAWPGGDYTLFWAQTFDPAGDGPILTVGYGER